MIQQIDAPISVQLSFNHQKRQTVPVRLSWEGREYRVTKVGLHHTYREGRTLHHIYSVQTERLFFRLNLDTETLFWRVEQIADGEPN